MADFDPRQLDELEDALESLEHVDDLEQLELDPELIERLAEYQDVLALCRDAFPLETPDDALLADVIAEAHEVSRRPRLRDVVDAEHGALRRFWERWRGTLVPGFALAGTAAAVLWILDPQGNANTDELLTDTSQTERRTTATQPEQTQPASEHELDQPAPKDEDHDELGDEHDDEAPVPATEQSEEPLGSAHVEQKRAKTKKSAPSSAPAVEPAPEPMNKDEVWAAIDRADMARRQGNCDRARSLYEDVIAASSDKTASARAKAGIGLCLEQDRRDSAAAEWFDGARASSPGIDSWIRQERDEMLPHKRKAQSKAEPAEADAFEPNSL